MVSKAKIRRKLAQADFTDDVMFELVMSQLEICRKFLKAVLPQLDFTKIKVVDQSHLKIDYLSKAGRSLRHPLHRRLWQPIRYRAADDQWAQCRSTG